ncbi:glycoside hydrolase family 10 protein [Adhaeretor mobilis]|nr:family 10 glycosylhydrolase [Adhaeretor mobilis]
MLKVSLCLLSAIFALSLANSTSAEFSERRSIFVDRYDFNYSGNISTMTNQINGMMQSAADEGFTDIVWQVRGRGDALYNSNFEPAISNLTPGFDPLQTALDAAHSRGLKVHAWFNSTTLWNTNNLNPPSGHIFNNTNPSFRLEELSGNLEPQDGWGSYSSVNPILPEVHTHINNVVNDVAANYAVDGIHLDYIRYIPGTSDFDRLPHDTLSHTMFNSATGLDGSNPSNAAAYENYIASRITDLVGSVGQTVDAAETSTGRAMEFSASVWRDPDVAVNDYMQDYRTWLENDLLDIVMPMIYLSASNDGTYFNDNLLNTMRTSTDSRVMPTFATYLHAASGGGGAALTRSQIERAYFMGADGVGFYDFPTYFDTNSNPAYNNAERESIRDLFNEIANASSTGSSIDNFDADEGHFNSSPTLSGSNQGINGATAQRVTTEAQAGDGSQELVIDGSNGGWFLRHLSGGGSVAANQEFASTGSIGFWLKTEDEGLTVQIALDDPNSADRGFLQPVQADGEWHLYQWNLEDDRQWEAWASEEGSITGSTVTIDSIQFFGAGDATIYLDSVSHNPDGYLAGLTAAGPGDFDADGDIDADDLAQWQGDYGVNGLSDADNDDDSDGLDFLTWQQNYAPASSSAAANTVPEPSTLALLIGLTLMPRCRRSKFNH